MYWLSQVIIDVFRRSTGQHARTATGVAALPCPRQAGTRRAGRRVPRQAEHQWTGGVSMLPVLRARQAFTYGAA